MTQAVVIAQSGSNNTTFRNRIINGAMMIDQRNNGASATYGSGSTAGNYYGYNIDRWFAQSYSSTVGNGAAFTVQLNAGSVTPPAGYKNYLGVTVTSAQATLQTDSLYRILQIVEGYNTVDFAFGSASASAVTLSFWVRSSVTGTFSGTVNNNGNGGTVTRYLYTYTINAANTWEQKTITIPAATTGSWGTTNSYGVTAEWCLGAASGRLSTANVWGTGDQQGATGTTNLMATSGATFYITGVQLEKGTVATPFEQRLYGTELSLCQRYWWPLRSAVGVVGSSTAIWRTNAKNPVFMRSNPTLTLSGSMIIQAGNVGGFNLTSVGTNYSTNEAVEFDGGTSTAPTTGVIAILLAQNSNYIGVSAEL